MSLQLEESFSPASSDGTLQLNNLDLKRLSDASQHWRERVSGQIQSARACLELFVPEDGENIWKLNFLLPIPLWVFSTVLADYFEQISMIY